ncbi:MAG TPA: hypothetical protein VN110_09140 [Sphingobium sp.]|nr:hypothetical protein [Sphingobium sp.]
MARTLKVYRTPIGFHDAYVAASSQKAALKAWGTDTNLFARGTAEQVTQADLVREPLAHPGAVIKRPRGSEAEHLASIAKSRQPQARKEPLGKTSNAKKPQAKALAAPRVPRPSRDALNAAEEAVVRQATDAKAELKLLEEKQAQLRAEIEQLRKMQRQEAGLLDRRAETERHKYDAALERWRAS